MEKNVQTSSLLPLLRDSGGPFYLDITSVRSQQTLSGDLPLTYLPDYCDDPLALGYRAVVRTDGGSVVRSLMLLVQRDRYPDFIHPSARVTNTVVDSCWQQAMKAQCHGRECPGMVIFSGQIGDADTYLPFAPLFFCSQVSRYFHPPCPHCGEPLELCQDDGLLENSGLPYYSQSLRRYLHCPACSLSDGHVWYTLTTALSGEESVKDCTQLVHDFGTMRQPGSEASAFPCSGCKHQQNCYGSDQSAFRNLSVVSFYPFFLIVSDDFDCSGEDYLALVSGASIEGLRAYRLRTGTVHTGGEQDRLAMPLGDTAYLFPADSPKHFLEILFLKMQFLKVAVERLFRDVSPGSLSVRHLLPKNLGVSLRPGGSLPGFWDFSLSSTIVSSYLDEKTPNSGTVQANPGYWIGLLWFVVLLRNEKHDELEIIARLEMILDNESEDAGALLPGMRLFDPRNIYWSQAKREDHFVSSGQWEILLNAGWQMLRAGRRGQAVDEHSIRSTIQECLESLEVSLFDSSPDFRPDVNPSSSDLEIIGILRDSSRRRRMRGAAEEKADAVNSSEVDPEKTVIIEPDGIGHEEISQIPPPYPPPQQDDDPFGETVIIQETGVGLPAGPPKPANHRVSQDILNSTTRDGGDLEETVRLKAVPERTVPGRDSEAGAQPPGKEEEPDFLEETIVLGKHADGHGTGTKGNAPASEVLKDDDDFLTETIVLTPGRKGGVQ